MALSASFLEGCIVNFDETTLVHIRDPSAVTVAARTPDGSQSLLDAGEGPQQAEISPTKPPFTELIKYAVVARTTTGAVTLECPSCLGAEAGTVVPAGGPIELRGDPGRTLVWKPEGLGMRFAYEALFRCHRGRGDCPREALALWLATPASNVTEIRYRKLVSTGHGERTGAWISAILGAAIVLGGSVVAVGTSVAEGAPSEPGLIIGGACMAHGGFFFTAGLLGILAKDSDTTVFRAP
jgi:hypothetical protein